MSDLHVYAFGKLRMQCGNVEVASFPTRHVEELFGYLILNPRAHHSREKLIEILWPSSSPHNARARFSTVLWRLRAIFSQLGLLMDDYLQVSRDWVAFAPRHTIRLDTAAFESMLTTTTAPARPSGEGQPEQLLRAAIALYRGELCEGIYADWCLLERERLARYYLRALGHLMAHLIQHEAYEEAVSLGQKILQYDPLREEVHRAIIYCYWQMNAPVQAVYQFQACSHLLMEELQTVPMPETLNLYRQVMAGRLHHFQNSIMHTNLADIGVEAAFREFQQAGDKLNELLVSLES
jgi:DNA-binding SARP family transcriptional activator